MDTVKDHKVEGCIMDQTYEGFHVSEDQTHGEGRTNG